MTRNTKPDTSVTTNPARNTHAAHIESSPVNGERLLYLLLGVGLVVVATSAARYLLTPTYFRPGGVLVLVIAFLAVLAVLVLHGRQAR